MKMKLKKHEQMLFALLKSSLNQKRVETDCFQGATDEQWKQCYQTAARQGVMALAWDGIMTLPSTIVLPRALKLTWGVAVQDYEKKYERYCRTVEELTDLYLRNGIMTVQLKGVGLSAYYPVPSHREGGDIDIFTYSNLPDRMTDREANRLADRLMEEQGIEVDMHSPKHSNFCYKGIPIENHKTFLNVETYPVAVQVDALLRKVLVPQFTYLMDAAYKVLTPPPAFNAMFLAFHASQHYGSGLALHHLCDWAALINKYGIQLPEELKDKRFLEAIAAFTHLCNEYLGTSAPVSGGRELAEEMLEEILHPAFPDKEVPVKGKWNILVYKTRRFFHRSRVSNRILYLPLWKRIWMSVVSHVSRPETIFLTRLK